MKAHIEQEKFGDRVRIAADSIGGQAELSRRTGISKVSLAAYISGDSEPSRERLIAIAKAAKVGLLWLALGEGPMRAEDNIPPKTEASRQPEPQSCVVDASGRVTVPRWQDPDPEMFDYIPMIEAHLSAGGGCFVISEEVEGYYAFRKSWLSRVASGIKNLVLMRVHGDSMSPTLQDGDTVMIDTGCLSIKEGMMYALRFDSTIMVKRLAFRPGGRIQIISDNRQEYDPFEVETKELHILGQIIFFCRTFVPD